MKVLGVLASPNGSGTTAAALEAFLAGCRQCGATTNVLKLASSFSTVVTRAAIEESDAVVFASPTYRSTYSALLARTLESLERGLPRGRPAPLRGKAGAVLMTGATPQHMLATERLQQVLSSFFALPLLSPPLFVTSTDLREESCRTHGRALVELAAACRSSDYLGQLPPLV